MVTDQDDDQGFMSQGRWAPPTYRPPHLKEGELGLIRKRQRDRARLMAWLLGLFVVLMFFITIAKIGANW